MTQQADELTRSLEDEETVLVDRAAVGELITDARDKAAYILLFGEAKRAAIKARTALVNHDAEDAKGIRRLQNIALRYEDMAEWVRTAVVEGKNAFDALQAARGEREPDEVET